MVLHSQESPLGLSIIENKSASPLYVPQVSRAQHTEHHQRPRWFVLRAQEKTRCSPRPEARPTLQSYLAITQRCALIPASRFFLYTGDSSSTKPSTFSRPQGVKRCWVNFTAGKFINVCVVNPRGAIGRSMIGENAVRVRSSSIKLFQSLVLDKNLSPLNTACCPTIHRVGL